MRLLHRKALITGAASGIGLAIAERFVMEGADVACVDVNADRLQNVVDTLRNGKSIVAGVTADLSIASEAKAAVEKSMEELNGLDIVVNNAGANATGTIDEFTHEQWERTVAINLSSYFSICKYTWQHFVSQGHGVVLNTSSIMGITGARQSFAYCACKAGIIALTKSLAADGGPAGIRVNCVCPGFVATPAMDAAHSGGYQSKITRQLPIRRMAKPREVADAFVYLASDEASYANGTVLVLDGGATLEFAGCFVAQDQNSDH